MDYGKLLSIQRRGFVGPQLSCNPCGAAQPVQKCGGHRTHLSRVVGTRAETKLPSILLEENSANDDATLP